MSNIYFSLEEILNQILLGDATEILKRIPSESVDCIIIDPPYGIDFKTQIYNDTKIYVFSHYLLWLAELYRILKTGGHIYLFIPTKRLKKWLIGVEKFFTYKNLLAFPVYANNKYELKNNFGENAQYVIFAHKGKGRELNKIDWIPTSECWKNDKRNTNPKDFIHIYPNYFGNIIYANIKNNTIRKAKHPNEKNPELIQKFIELSTNENEIVLDCFCGSGTTAIASLKAKRNFIGIEMNEEMWSQSNNRITKYQKKQQVLFNNSLNKWFHPISSS